MTRRPVRFRSACVVSPRLDHGMHSVALRVCPAIIACQRVSVGSRRCGVDADGGAAPPRQDRGREIPFWLLAAALLAVLFLWLIVADNDYRIIFHALRQGVLTTLWVTIVAFALAALLGLVVALGRTSRFRVVREIATFYVEIVRGIPVLVLLFYVAFVGAPQLVVAVELAFAWPIAHGLAAGAHACATSTSPGARSSR